MKKILFGLMGIAGLAVLSSCEKSEKEISEPASSVNFKFMATNDDNIFGMNPERDAVTEETGVFTWTGGTAYVDLIKFEAKGDEKLKFKSTVDQNVDLFAAWASLGSIQVPVGTYQNVEFKISLKPTEDHPALQLMGTYANNGVTTPIHLIVDQAFTMKFEKKTPTVISADMDHEALAALSLKWLAENIDENILLNAEKVNGTVVLSKDVNAQLYELLWKAALAFDESNDMLKVKFN